MKNLKIFSLISFLILLSFSICSCGKDDPIIPPNPPDPGDTIDAYTWVNDTLNGYAIEDIYQLDSDHVYLAANPQPFLYQNSEFKPIGATDYEYIANCIQAFDPNYVVSAGSILINNNPQYSAAFRIFHDGIVETFIIPGDTIIWDIRNMLLTERNQIWFTNGTNKVYHFDNGNISTITINESLHLNLSQFSFRNNTVYVLGRLWDSNDVLKEIKIYQLNGSSFETYNDITGNDLLIYRTYEVNNEFIFSDIRKLFYLDGNSIVPFSNLTFFDYPEYSGTSRADLIRVQGLNFHGPFIHTWNGTRWRKEISFNIIGGPRIDNLGITAVKNGWVFVAFISHYNLTYICTGKKK